MFGQVGLTSPLSFRASTLPPMKLHAATLYRWEIIVM
jgi:hypothetical protein